MLRSPLYMAWYTAEINTALMQRAPRPVHQITITYNISTYYKYTRK
nr:MAG TPA: hypothetical protein [Caudoviricetes sp.]